MRAAMWWIDRWRQSDAFAMMTAEEQGLYRNLCDEVFLRDDGVIPDDQRILAKASGDHEAWSRSGANVLKSMKRVDGGWTNETALEVKTESERRSRKQRDYRNGLGNERGNGSGNETRPPDMDQETYTDKSNRIEIEKVDQLNDDFESEERRLTGLLVGIRNSGQDVQEFLDSCAEKGRKPFSAYTWLRSGRSGVPCKAEGLTVLRLTCDAIEAKQRSKGRPVISENNQKAFDAIDQASAMRAAARLQSQKPKEIQG